MVLIAKYSNTVTWNLQTKYDGAGLVKMEAALERMISKIDQGRSIFNGKGILGNFSADQTIGELRKVQKAFSDAYKSELGMFDTKQLTASLNQLNFKELFAGLSAGQTNIKGLSVQASQFFTRTINAAGKINTEFKSINGTVDKFVNSFLNTARWGITAAAFQGIMNSIRGSVEYIKELDTSLNNIRVVTGYSAEDMKTYADYANQAAQSLGVSTVAFTDAAQLYAQNGYNVEDQKKLAELTIKTANVTQADVVSTSEHITALINGYQLSIDEAEKALDGMAKVAAASASDLDELATAQERVAATANMLGVSQEQLTSQLSTIVSVTRLAPESVGTALRTLYSRFADLELGETLEDGVNLGEVSTELQKVGVNVLDVNGELRDMGSIVEDLMGVWSELSTTQQQALAGTIAGKRQTTMIAALLENPEMYYDQLKMAQEAAGTLEEQQEIRMESLEAKLASVGAAAEGLWSSFIDSDAIKGLVDVLEDVLNLVTSIVNALGGGGNIGGMLTGLLIQGGANQIGQTLSNIHINRQKSNLAKSNMSGFVDTMKALGADFNEDTGEFSMPQEGHTWTGNNNAQLMTNVYKSFRGVERGSIEDINQHNTMVQEASKLVAQAFHNEASLYSTISAGEEEIRNAASKISNEPIGKIFKDEKFKIWDADAAHQMLEDAKKEQRQFQELTKEEQKAYIEEKKFTEEQLQQQKERAQADLKNKLQKNAAYKNEYAQEKTPQERFLEYAKQNKIENSERLLDSFFKNGLLAQERGFEEDIDTEDNIDLPEI